MNVETLREYARRAGRHPRTVAGGLPSGALAGQVSREVWAVLNERDQQAILAIDDCESGRFDAAELRRRLYPSRW